MKTFMRLSVFAAVTAMAAPSMAQTELVFAHPTPTSDIQHLMAEFFAAEMNERTNGEIVVNIFPAGQLGSDAQMLDGVRSGIIDFQLAGLNNYTGLVPEAGAATLPFMFPDRDTAYRVLDGEFGDYLRGEFEEFGLFLLGLPENGFRNMTNNRGPIVEPADVVGLQMRVNNSQALSDMFEALGANPVQLDVNELYTALETGVVNSQDHPIPVTLSFRFHEVQDYLSLTRHAYSPVGWMMNLNTYNSLSPEHQTILLEVAAEAVDYQRNLAIESEEAMLETLSADVEINDNVNSAAFQDASRPAWERFIENYGSDVIDMILEASAAQ